MGEPAQLKTGQDAVGVGEEWTAVHDPDEDARVGGDGNGNGKLCTPNGT